MTTDLDRTRPVWQQVAAAIATRIADGTYPVNARVPSVVELSAEVGLDSFVAGHSAQTPES